MFMFDGYDDEDLQVETTYRVRIRDGRTVQMIGDAAVNEATKTS